MVRFENFLFDILLHIFSQQKCLSDVNKVSTFLHFGFWNDQIDYRIQFLDGSKWPHIKFFIFSKNIWDLLYIFNTKLLKMVRFGLILRFKLSQKSIGWVFSKKPKLKLFRQPIYYVDSLWLRERICNIHVYHICLTHYC